jgi:hypothetical protein
MTTHFVTWKNFNTDRLIGGGISTGESQPKPDPNDPNKTTSVKFLHTTPEYEYDIVNPITKAVTKSIAPLRIQLPPITSSRGLSTKIGMSGYEKTTIFCKMDMSDPDVRAMCSMGEETHGLPDGMWKRLHSWCLEYLWTSKSQIPTVKALGNKALMAAVFAFPLLFKTNEDGKISNNDPTRFFDIMSFGNVGTPDHRGAVFRCPKVVGTVAGKPEYEIVPWSKLVNARVTFLPIVKFRRIYIGSKATMQLVIDSGAILDIVPASQDDSLDDILAEYSKDTSRVASLDANLNSLKERFNAANKEVEITKSVALPLPQVNSTGDDDTSSNPSQLETTVPKIKPLLTTNKFKGASGGNSFGTKSLSDMLSKAPVNTPQ